MNVREANRVRACLDCGEPGALLWRTTKGENTGRLLRICAACLRKDDWHRFGLVERQPILGEVPTEFFEGEWHFSKADGPEPWAVITYTDEPSPETGHVGWCWWAMGSMGDAPTYEAARDAAVAEIQRRMDRMSGGAVMPYVGKSMGRKRNARRRQLSVAHTAVSWNAAYPVGTAVRYWPIYPPIDGVPPEDTTTRSEAWTLGDGSVVVLVAGKTGGVYLSHVEVLP